MRNILLIGFCFVSFLVGALPENELNPVLERKAGENEAVLVLYRPFALGGFPFPIQIFIDDELRAEIATNETKRIILPNGEHSLKAKYYILKTDNVPFTASSNEINFSVKLWSGLGMGLGIYSNEKLVS